MLLPTTSPGISFQQELYHSVTEKTKLFASKCVSPAKNKSRDASPKSKFIFCACGLGNSEKIDKKPTAKWYVKVRFKFIKIFQLRFKIWERLARLESGFAFFLVNVLVLIFFYWTIKCCIVNFVVIKLEFIICLKGKLSVEIEFTFVFVYANRIRSELFNN